jgi:SAM-dependent methyltransferase
MNHRGDREASRVPDSERSQGRRFDRDYNVTTHAILFLNDLDPDTVGDAGAHATHYQAVPVRDFRALVHALPTAAIESATFVDAGAGMGRAVLLAAEYPFKQVVGVEISPALYEIALDNLARAPREKRRCRDVRLVRADARMWRYPSGNLVVFLFNPFDAEALRTTLGSILHRPNAGATWLLYHTPVEEAAIVEFPQWRLSSSFGDCRVYSAE